MLPKKAKQERGSLAIKTLAVTKIATVSSFFYSNGIPERLSRGIGLLVFRVVPNEMMGCFKQSYKRKKKKRTKAGYRCKSARIKNIASAFQVSEIAVLCTESFDSLSQRERKKEQRRSQMATPTPAGLKTTTTIPLNFFISCHDFSLCSNLFHVP